MVGSSLLDTWQMPSKKLHIIEYSPSSMRNRDFPVSLHVEMSGNLSHNSNSLKREKLLSQCESPIIANQRGQARVVCGSSYILAGFYSSRSAASAALRCVDSGSPKDEMPIIITPPKKNLEVRGNLTSIFSQHTYTVLGKIFIHVPLYI